MPAKTKPAAKKRAKSGRKLHPIDPEQVTRLAQIQCTLEEMGAFFGCDLSTVHKRFPKEIAKGREIGKISLRRKQWQTAMAGNVTMMIWLGKQYLGQADKIENDVHDTRAAEERKRTRKEDEAFLRLQAKIMAEEAAKRNAINAGTNGNASNRLNGRS